MSIDTVQIDSMVDVIDKGKALHENPKYNNKTGLYQYIANINNLSEDGKQIYKYSDYIRLKTGMIITTKMIDANTVRVDLAFDSFDGDYKTLYPKIKYLLMLIANKYKVKNIYECVNQWTLDPNSMNLKSQYFDIECYDKDSQENKSENENGIKIRLEFRMKKLYDDDEERKEITAFNNLKTNLNKATSDKNISDLNERMIEILLNKISEYEDTNKPDETLTMYQTNIFNKYILENVYAASDKKYKDPKQKAKRFIQKKKLMMYSEKDIKNFVDELIKTGEKYFQN